ncbi:tetratricopeptide repeat protein [Bacteroidales bacterium OttesenSCG-928-I14]|nr:tetratricopeptide repeat protein [Bacteroidales bacterium OttesenSCG-928-I14]
MANKSNKQVAQTKAEQSADALLSKTDQFLDKHLKAVITVASIVVIVVLGFIGLRHFYVIPKEKNAQDAIFVAENYFAQKQWANALDGDSIGGIGFIEIIDDFGSTKTGNLAKAYAGICEYQLGNYESALKHLKAYKHKDKVYANIVTGLIGDCHVELGNINEGATHFLKAAKSANDDQLSPIYFKKAGIAFENLGKYKEAVDAYTQIEEKYPNSTEGRNIEKEIIRAKSLIK